MRRFLFKGTIAEFEHIANVQGLQLRADSLRDLERLSSAIELCARFERRMVRVRRVLSICCLAEKGPPMFSRDYRIAVLTAERADTPAQIAAELYQVATLLSLARTIGSPVRRCSVSQLVAMRARSSFMVEYLSSISRDETEIGRVRQAHQAVLDTMLDRSRRSWIGRAVRLLASMGL